MKHVVMTGAAGDVATALRPLLRARYPDLVLSDIRQSADLATGERFAPADLVDTEALAVVLDGAEGIVHLGGHSVEGSWQAILQANIVGARNLFEAARLAGIKRIVFASSNHAVGFYRRTRRIGPDVTVRPDSLYGVSKAFGEALSAFYADKYGIAVTCLRIGTLPTGRSTCGGCRSGYIPRIWRNWCASASSIPIFASKCCTEHPTTRPRGGTIAAPEN